MARRKRMATPKSKPPIFKAVKVDGRVVETALRLAKGDRSRMVIQPDGSIIVRNPKHR